MGNNRSLLGPAPRRCDVVIEDISHVPLSVKEEKEKVDCLQKWKRAEVGLRCEPGTIAKLKF